MDPYSILGIARGATTDQIKRAYRKLAQKWHPDLNPSEEAKAKFISIQAAYDHLVNGKPFKLPANPGPSARANTQQPRQNSTNSRAQTPPRQSSATQADRLRKRQRASEKRQQARNAASAKRASERQKYTAEMQSNRARTTQTVAGATAATSALIEMTMQDASRRLEEARQEYVRTIKSIENARDELIRQARAIRDQKVAQATAVRNHRERELMNKNLSSDAAYQAELQRIERQYQADLAAAG